AVDEARDHVDPPVAGPVRQRPAQRGGLHLLRRALGVTTRLRAVHDATAGELRRTDRALPGAAGALLPIRLRTATRDLAAGLGRMGTLPGRRQLCHHDLVDQRHVHLDVEDLGRQFDRAVRGALRVQNGDGTHFFVSPFAAVRTNTKPPSGPGTAPLSSSTPFSASTACTDTFIVVTRSPPIRPGSFLPLNTRPGGAAPPMAPGGRCWRCTPCAARPPPTPWRFMAPAKPLPLVVPVTSTSSPASSPSAVSS